MVSRLFIIFFLPRSGLSNIQSPVTSVDDGDDEEFLYPGALVDTVVSPQADSVLQGHPPSSASLESPVFVYPGASLAHSESASERVEVLRQRNPPSPAQLESLCAAASSGDLPLLKRLFRNALETGDVEPFGLANDASSRTGFTALHVAASRGYLEMVIWCKILISRGKCVLISSSSG